jgi:hypothetical protein
MSDDALEEDIHPSLSLPDFCPVPVCFNVRERAFRAVDVPQNAININTLEFVDCLREAGAGLVANQVINSTRNVCAGR